MPSFPTVQNQPAGAIPVYQGFSDWAVLGASAGSSQLYTGTGYLKAVLITTGAASSTLTLYDGTSSSGTLIGVWSTAAPEPPLMCGIPLKVGLFAVVVGTGQSVTVGWDV